MAEEEKKKLFEYKEGDAVVSARDAREAHEAKKPGEFSSKYGTLADRALSDYVNREEFSYDVNDDALYNQFKDNYIRDGKLVMRDTMGQAAAMTGGFGNSYAATVGNQVYQQHMGELNDIIPELYDRALAKYTADGDALLAEYGLYSDREAKDYERHRDEVADWESERGYLDGRYDIERSFDYNKQYNEAVLGYEKAASEGTGLAYVESMSATEIEEAMAGYSEAGDNRGLAAFLADLVNTGRISQATANEYYDLYSTESEDDTVDTTVKMEPIPDFTDPIVAAELPYLDGMFAHSDPYAYAFEEFIKRNPSYAPKPFDPLKGLGR